MTDDISKPPKSLRGRGRPKGTHNSPKTDIDKLKGVAHSLVGRLAVLSEQEKPSVSPAVQRWLFGSKDSALTTVMTLTELLLLLDKATHLLSAGEPSAAQSPSIADADVALIEDFISKIREDKNEPLV